MLSRRYSSIIMHHFFVDFPLAEHVGQTLALPAPVAHQVGRVLRLRPGATIALLDGSGMAFPVHLTGSGGGLVSGRVGAGEPVESEPRVALTLYVAPLKGDHFAYTLQKATEIGAAAFVPVVTARTVAAEASGAKLERWRRIAREAAEQSGRGRVPVVHAPQPFAVACAAAVASGPALIPWEDERGRSLGAAVQALGPVSTLGLFIGPEGGFTEAEIATATAAGIAPVTLGRRILRAETAAAVATALALAALGEME
jgi:16S rRNA (uracil1498-N3)-methyltransferase